VGAARTPDLTVLAATPFVAFLSWDRNARVADNRPLLNLYTMSLISRIRTLFTLGKGVVQGLSEAAAGHDPIALFGTWMADANQSGMRLPNAMTVATCTKDGLPSARMMLLKGFDEHGFVFYTNYESRKADELYQNPQAALVFHWSALERQVRIEGTVEKVSAEESDAYFRTRPRGSRLGAWASAQSSVLDHRSELEKQFREYKQKFGGDEVPLPPFWGGFRLAPRRIEFWQGRMDRLHDRLRFTREGGGAGWTVARLYP
jgi:pyridoxamine 5'-phosphate oxidase